MKEPDAADRDHSSFKFKWILPTRDSRDKHQVVNLNYFTVSANSQNMVDLMRQTSLIMLEKSTIKVGVKEGRTELELSCTSICLVTPSW